jgi:hypothetical protein
VLVHQRLHVNLIDVLVRKILVDTPDMKRTSTLISLKSSPIATTACSLNSIPPSAGFRGRRSVPSTCNSVLFWEY